MKHGLFLAHYIDMHKLKYSFLTIKALLFISVIFMFLPSCGQKSIRKAPGYLSNIDTAYHPHRQGQRIAIRTATRIDTPSSTSQEETIRIEDVSIQEQRVVGDQLEATLKHISDGEEKEIDLIGTIERVDSKITAELYQKCDTNLVHSVESDTKCDILVHGKAECIDEHCHQIVLDIYYRDESGDYKRHQVQSVTPEMQVEITEDAQQDPSDNPKNPDNQQEPFSQTEEAPGVETPKNEQHTNVNTPPDIPEGHIEEPLSTIVTRPPQDLEALQGLSIPVPATVEQQPEPIKQGFEEEVDVYPVQETPTTNTDENTTQEQSDDISFEEIEEEIEEAMGITVSNFLEDYYNKFGYLAYKRQAINRRSSGILENAELLVRDTYGIKWLQHGDDHLKWVTSITNNFIQTIGSAFKEKHPNHFIIINRSSRKHGGHLRPHKTHQNGLDLDIAYPNVDPKSIVDPTSPNRISSSYPRNQRFWSVFDGTENFIMSAEDADLTMNLLRVMSETGIVNKYHVDQAVKDFLTARATHAGRLREDCPVLTQLCHAGGHRNHIHVQLKCTQFNGGCHDSADPPYSTCPAPTACQGL